MDIVLDAKCADRLLDELRDSPVSEASAKRAARLYRNCPNYGAAVALMDALRGLPAGRQLILAKLCSDMASWAEGHGESAQDSKV